MPAQGGAGGFGGFGANGGESARTAPTEAEAPKEEQTEIESQTQAQTETPVPTGNETNSAGPEAPQPADSNSPGDRPSALGGIPGGGDFPGTRMPDQSSQWRWLAGCGALLLTAILIIRRAGNHND